jgi:hypothetical protein
MRVSPTWNSLVAPRLYRSVTINDRANSFDPALPLGRTIRKRKTQSKIRNLQYIEELVYTPHTAKNCATGRPLAKQVQVPIVRYEYCCSPTASRLSAEEPRPFDQRRNYQCGCSGTFKPDKLVMYSSLYHCFIADPVVKVIKFDGHLEIGRVTCQS